MAHFALINSSYVVEQVVAVHNNELLMEDLTESEQKGIEFLQQLLPLVVGTWVQTSYNSNFRKNYAGLGSTYDPVRQAFYAPRPFPSWNLDADCRWQPPVPCPDGHWRWQEATQSWQEEA